MNQEAKRDEGKLQLSLVPTQIIRDIAEVRMYGNKKYGDPDNWKNVEMERYIDALYRHFLAFIDDPYSVDEESGIPHRKHMACNMAFICHMMKDVDKEKEKEEEPSRPEVWDIFLEGTSEPKTFTFGMAPREVE